MLSDHYRSGVTERLLVRVITVDPTNGRVEVVGKDAAVIQINVSRMPALFRWPIQGEFWTIRRENGEWGLEEKVADPDSKKLTELAPGEAMVQAEKVWTPSGDYLAPHAEIDDLQDQIDEIALITGGGGVPLDAWHIVGQPGEPAFLNGWTNFGGIYPPLAFRKDPFGKVQIRGSIKNGTVNQAAFVLPANYRPPGDAMFVSRADGSWTTDAVLWIRSNGEVVIYLGHTAYVGLDVIEFDTDTVTSVINTTAVQMDDWHTFGNPGEPTLQNGWVHYGGSEKPAGFRKDPHGRVNLRGFVKNGTGGDIVTLPVGYRPDTNGSFSFAATAYNGTAYGIAYVFVKSNGGVTVHTSPFYPGTGTGFIDLSPISFDTNLVDNYVVGAIPDPPEAWHVVGDAVTGMGVSFVNGWLHNDASSTTPNYAAGQRNARFYKDRNRVYLDGVIKAGTVSANAFVLPVGYRPNAQKAFPVLSNGVFGFVTVEPNGAVFMGNVSNVYVFLDSISFSVS